MTTTSVGQRAESAAAEYLESLGYEILKRNYRTPKCEIDIISKKDDCIYFIEVKYRSGDRQGPGMDYITSKKRKQMAYAAETWISQHNWHEDVVLSAIEVSGSSFIVQSFIEEIA